LFLNAIIINLECFTPCWYLALRMLL